MSTYEIGEWDEKKCAFSLDSPSLCATLLPDMHLAVTQLP